MKAISLKLPDSLFHDLSLRAKASANSQSEIIRSALALYLKSDSMAQTASCAQRASRWIGIVDGPQDLSTNSEHLSGFGQ
jgi:Arc/MetJ-type ribon-helix-helix transcriptional regulator